MSVSVAVLDEDHKILIQFLNQLDEGIRTGYSHIRLGQILDSLVEYVSTHFAREEQFFAQTGYPQTTEHIQLHQAITKLLLDIQKRYQSGRFDALSRQALDFLRDWMAEHFTCCDSEYKEHLNAHGIH